MPPDPTLTVPPNETFPELSALIGALLVSDPPIHSGPLKYAPVVDVFAGSHPIHPIRCAVRSDGLAGFAPGVRSIYVLTNKFPFLIRAPRGYRAPG